MRMINCVPLNSVFFRILEKFSTAHDRTSSKDFGSRNQRLLKRYQKTVAVINALEPEFQALSDEALRAKTESFRQRASNGEALDALLPEAFAACREASRRALKMRHFDVQLIGGMA